MGTSPEISSNLSGPKPSKRAADQSVELLQQSMEPEAMHVQEVIPDAPLPTGLQRVVVGGVPAAPWRAALEGCVQQMQFLTQQVTLLQTSLPAAGDQPPARQAASDHNVSKQQLEQYANTHCDPGSTSQGLRVFQ